MVFTEQSMKDLKLTAQEREAERELVAEAMKAYENGSLLLPGPVRDHCRQIAAIKAQRAALLDDGRAGGGAG